MAKPESPQLMQMNDRPGNTGRGQALKIAAVCATLVGGYCAYSVPAIRAAIFNSSKPSVDVKKSDASSTQKSTAGQRPPAPVHVQGVERQDFPLSITGLGTVQATNSVTVRSRVDGQIAAVLFQEGQRVNEGDVLIRIDAAPFQAALNQATAKLAQDQASLKNAQQDLARTQTLSKDGYAATQVLDQRTAAVAQLTALLQVDAAAIDAAKVQLAYTSIVAPITGVIGFRLVDKGNIVRATDTTGMLSINQTRPISVVFTAPEQQLPAITAALSVAPPATMAYTSNGKKLLGEGLLKLVDNQIDQASGSIRLKASFENLDDAFWPGLSVATKLRIGTLKSVVVTPDAAVQRGPNGLFVYVADRADKAVLRPVKVGPIADGMAVIEDGLSVGERVVISGHYRVQSGGALQILPAVAPVATGEPISDKGGKL